MGEANLGDSDGNNVKKFNVKYYRDVGVGSKILRADSPNIAPFDSKTQGDEWRYNLAVGDRIDVFDYLQQWTTATVIKKDQMDDPNKQLYQLVVGFRLYSSDGDLEDEMGKYFGKGKAFDLHLPVYSLRVQRANTLALDADNSPVVWRFRNPQSENDSAKPTTSSASGTNKLQDERDMAMLTEPDQHIYATERSSCKSTFFVELVNKFGDAGSFNHLLSTLSDPSTSLQDVYHLVCFFTKSHSVYHKQFVDAFYDPLRQAVETKLLSATSAQLRSIKLSRIEEIITQVWQNLLMRVHTYFELQVLKSKLSVRVGLLFMK